MKAGIISDAHGNLAALQLSLNFLLKCQQVDCIYYLGDAIGYFPDSAAVCSLLDHSCDVCLMGNHEYMLLHGNTRDELAQVYKHPPKESLPQGWLRKVAECGAKTRRTVCGCKILLVHGTPANPLDGRMDETVGAVADADADVILMGHSHRPHIARSPDGTLLLNPGSCGYPRDHGELLSVATLSLPEMEARIWRLPFRLESQKAALLHPMVRSCLGRTATDIVGTIIDI